MKQNTLALALMTAATILPVPARAADDFCSRIIIYAINQFCQLLPNGQSLCQPIALAGPAPGYQLPGLPDLFQFPMGPASIQMPTAPAASFGSNPYPAQPFAGSAYTPLSVPPLSLPQLPNLTFASPPSTPFTFPTFTMPPMAQVTLPVANPPVAAMADGQALTRLMPVTPLAPPDSIDTEKAAAPVVVAEAAPSVLSAPGLMPVTPLAPPNSVDVEKAVAPVVVAEAAPSVPSAPGLMPVTPLAPLAPPNSVDVEKAVAPVVVAETAPSVLSTPGLMPVTPIAPPDSIVVEKAAAPAEVAENAPSMLSAPAQPEAETITPPAALAVVAVVSSPPTAAAPAEPVSVASVAPEGVKSDPAPVPPALEVVQTEAVAKTEAATPASADIQPVAATLAVVDKDALAHFEFDSAELTEAGRAMLDSWLAESTGNLPIQVTGHADRLGPEPYNKRLSLQRAETVKKYLTEKGVSLERIQLQAKGEAVPVINCPGGANLETILCLAPNRRAEVVVQMVVQPAATALAKTAMVPATDPVIKAVVKRAAKVAQPKRPR